MLKFGKPLLCGVLFPAQRFQSCFCFLLQRKLLLVFLRQGFAVLLQGEEVRIEVELLPERCGLVVQRFQLALQRRIVRRILPGCLHSSRSRLRFRSHKGQDLPGGIQTGLRLRFGIQAWYDCVQRRFRQHACLFPPLHLLSEQIETTHLRPGVFQLRQVPVDGLSLAVLLV